MSKYTTTVKEICEFYINHITSKTKSIDEVITIAAPYIFDFDFPIFDENYRTPLEKTILHHYFMREIGLETIALWKFYLADKLRLIMPRYNGLYKSAVLEFNPLFDVDIKTTHQTTFSGVQSTEGEESETFTREQNKIDATVAESETAQTVHNNVTTNNTETSSMQQQNETEQDELKLYTDTPQGGVDGFGDNVNPSYLSNASKNKGTKTEGLSGSGTSNANTTEEVNSSTSENTTETVNTTASNTENHTKDTNNTGNTTVQNTEEYIETITGKNGGKSYSEMINEFRSTLISVDEQLVKELEPLFMGLW